MMRLSLWVLGFVLTLAVSISAQTPLTVRAFENGTRAAQAGEFETAIEKYRQAILFSETEPASSDLLARVRFNLGVCLFKLERNEAAGREFTEAVKLSRRTYQKAYHALGMAESALKNWQAAERALRSAVELKKDDGEAWFDLGLVLIERENYEAAAEAFQKAIKFGSVAAADAHNNLGVMFALKADFPAAETEFVTALAESNGKSIEARGNLEFCKLFKRNFDRNLLAKMEFSRSNRRGE